MDYPVYYSGGKYWTAQGGIKLKHDRAKNTSRKPKNTPRVLTWKVFREFWKLVSLKILMCFWRISTLPPLGFAASTAIFSFFEHIVFFLIVWIALLCRQVALWQGDFSPGVRFKISGLVREVSSLKNPQKEFRNAISMDLNEAYLPCIHWLLFREIILTGSGGSTQQQKVDLDLLIFKIQVALTATGSRIWPRSYGKHIFFDAGFPAPLPDLNFRSFITALSDTTSKMTGFRCQLSCFVTEITTFQYFPLRRRSEV